MNFRRPLLLLTFLFGPILASPAAETAAPLVTATAQPWPQDGSDIKPDPAAVFGTLPNGFRYVILPNKEPPGRVSLRLRVNAGSFMEAENQRGLAHFLEHMAFNGSKHYAHDEMVSVFQRLGMGFGADTNANTSFQRTLYKLDLPDTKDGTLHEGMQYFGDIADGLLLEQTEVDRERGVILSEKRDRDSVDYRTFVASWEFEFPDSLLPQRLPIGLESVITEAQRDRFVDFYRKWYTPDRITLAVVGDIKPDDIVPLIKQYFGPIASRASSPDPDLGKFGTPGFAATLHKAPEARDITLELTSISPFTLGPDRTAREALELQMDAANFIISRRLVTIIRQPNAPISGGEADNTVEDGFGAFQSTSIDATCQPAQWETALDVIEQELRRALQYGFTAAEVEEARANFENSFEEQAKTAATRKTRDLANEVADSFDRNTVFTSPAQDLALAQPVLAALTPQQCLDALKKEWGASGRRLFVAGNLDLPDAAKTLTAAYDKSAAVAVEKPADNSTVAFAYASMGTPGTVAERHEVTDLGITQLRFANNVRVNLKHTDFEANKIHVLVQFGGGLLDLPADKPALALVANSIFTEGGLGKHSAEDLQRILAGKNVSAGFSVSDDFFELGGTTTPQDFRLELELLKARLTDPGYRPEALAQARRGFPAMFNELRENIDGPLENEVPRFIASGDAKFGYPTQVQAEAITTDDVRNWLAPSLKDSYLEISIVGDFDPKAVEADLAATFGMLPPRALNRADYSAALKVKFPADEEGKTKTFTVPTVIPKAEAMNFWPTIDRSDMQRVRALNVLTSIFSDRLRVQVRQKLGEAYSPTAANDSSPVYPKYGYALTLITADPKLAISLNDLARVIGDSLAAGPITQDEFDRAITPVRKTLPETLRQNSYWLSTVLAASQFYPQHLDWARELPTAYDKITLDQVSALAKEYFGSDHAVRILIMPEPAEPLPAAKP